MSSTTGTFQINCQSDRDTHPKILVLTAHWPPASTARSRTACSKARPSPHQWWNFPCFTPLIVSYTLLKLWSARDGFVAAAAVQCRWRSLNNTATYSSPKVPGFNFFHNGNNFTSQWRDHMSPI